MYPALIWFIVFVRYMNPEELILLGTIGVLACCVCAMRDPFGVFVVVFTWVLFVLAPWGFAKAAGVPFVTTMVVWAVVWLFSLILSK